MSGELAASPILEGLNPQQRDAVLASEGPVLILAGAGSGKTRVITHRIAHLIHDRRVPSDQILAVTFTNKAANEMRERVSQLLGEELRVWIATFHSFCVRVLRRDGHEIGVPARFAILDEGQRQAVVREALRACGVSEQLFPPRRVLGWLSKRKNSEEAPVGSEADSVVDDVMEEYARRLTSLQALDFDDLLLRTRELFTQSAETCRRYRARLRYILVDEYQDTNRPQYDIVRLLAGEGGNITAVGDEDQSIYSWRGADIRNILAFEQDFPGARILRLEHNYRSNPAILEAASAVVANNTARKGKTLRSTRARGNPVAVREFETELDEASWVAREIREQDRAGETAVLMRLNAQSRVIEESLRRSGVPYTVVGGVGFFERREVKDLLAYLRVVARPEDDLALRRVINVPPRGIGERTMAVVDAQGGGSLWESLGRALEGGALGGRAEARLRPFVQLIEDLHGECLGVENLLRQLLERSGLEAWVQTLPQSQDRLANLRELISAAADFEARSADSGIAGFLDEASLASSTDDSPPSGSARLMTLHAAKGLEFRTVFMVGLEEGLLPFSRSRDSRAQLEEERRLCYVGMTRAMDQLWLSWARTRQIFGRRERSQPSRFLEELPPGVGRRSGVVPRAAQPATRMRPAASAPANVGGVGRGAPVRHATFGEGTVIRVDGSGPDAKLTVAFTSHGVKRLVARYAALEPL